MVNIAVGMPLAVFAYTYAPDLLTGVCFFFVGSVMAVVLLELCGL